MRGVCLILLEDILLLSTFKAAADQDGRSVSAYTKSVHDQLCDANLSATVRLFLPSQKDLKHSDNPIHNSIYRQDPLIGIRIASKTHSGNLPHPPLNASGSLQTALSKVPTALLTSPSLPIWHFR